MSRGIKLWIDDIRPAPSGYVHIHSVNEAKRYISTCEAYIERKMQMGHARFVARDPAGRTAAYQSAELCNIELIDIDHDAGEYAADGGDYIRLLDWLEQEGYSFPIRIHSMNSVGINQMQQIIRKNHWIEVR